MPVRLHGLVEKEGPLSAAEARLAREWIDEDWESNDHDGELIALVKRLLATLEEKKP